MPSIDEAIDDLGGSDGSVEVRHRSDTSAVIYTIKDGRPSSRYEVHHRGSQGFLVTSASACSSSS